MLFVNKSAVNLHLARVRKKMGARNTIELVYMLYGENQQSLSHIKLTPRGKEFFQLFIKGYSDNEIAKELGISYSAVRRHKEYVLERNECSAMIELVGKYYNLED